MKNIVINNLQLNRRICGCLKRRHFTSKRSPIHIEKGISRQEFPGKQSMTKGPNELFLKAISNDNPAAFGITRQDDRVTDFKSFGLREDICNALKEMNVEKPTAIQLESIAKILKGQNVLMTSQTGCGKTLGYLLPIIHILKTQEVEKGISSYAGRPRACVVVPFRELAVQILGVVKYISHFTKLRSLGLISGRKKKWKHEGLNTPVDIAVSTPHDLLRYLRKGDIYFSHLSHLVIDEADTMFDHSFQTITMEILRFAGIRPWLDVNSSLQTTFVSATVSRDLLQMSQNLIPNLAVCHSGLHKMLPHVSQRFVKIPQHAKSELLRKIITPQLTRQEGRQIMIFCNTTKSCDWTSYYLGEHGISHLRLNGKMKQKERRVSIEKFQEQQYNILVCTDVASRGLDTRNVGYVINFDFPQNGMDYIHRAGRTGRLGTTISCHVTSFISHNRELVIMERIKKAMQENLPIEDNRLLRVSHLEKQQKELVNARKAKI